MINRKSFLIIPFLVGGLFLSGCVPTDEATPIPSGPSMTDEATEPNKTPDVSIFGEVDVNYDVLEGDPWVFITGTNEKGLMVVQGTLTDVNQGVVDKTVEWFNSQFNEWGELVTSVDEGTTLYGVAVPAGDNNAQLRVVPSEVNPELFTMVLTVAAATKETP